MNDTIRVAVLAFTFACGSVMAQAQTDASPQPRQTPATATNPDSKLVASFTDLAGSQENAAALVKGLRTGTPITLTDPRAVSAPSTVTFTPGTKPMGYGNVRIALSLARAQLASQGIVNPTPEQLQAALVGPGGVEGATQGILQMRAAGMGWGQIAQAQGLNLGAVMGGRQGMTTAAGATAATGAAVAGQRGATTAAGVPGGGQGRSGMTTAAGGIGGGNPRVATGLGSGGGASSAGVANAAGGKGVGAGHGQGLGQGKGPK